MALPNKKRRGRRTIRVNGIEYYWRIGNRDRRSMEEGNVVLIVGETRSPHCRLTVRGQGLASAVHAVEPKTGSILGTFAHSAVAPALVRRAIEFAQTHGWPREQPTVLLHYSDERFSVESE